MQKLFFILNTLLITMSSCVTPKIHNVLHAEYDKAKIQIVKKDKKIIELNEKIEEQEELIASRILKCFNKVKVEHYHKMLFEGEKKYGRVIFIQEMDN